MVIFIQYPIADSRPFLQKDNGKMALPLWPNPSPNGEFVQSFGGIKPRKKGGVDGWIGERLICDARSAIKVNNIKTFSWKELAKKRAIQLKCSSRHLYSNGGALSKVEVVFTTKSKRINLPKDHTVGFISNILGTEFTVKIPNQKSVDSNLINLNKYIAEKYLYSTTYNYFTEDLIEKEWVQPGIPVMVIMCGEREHIGSPISKTLSLPDGLKLTLQQFWHKFEGKYIRVWLIKEHEGFDSEIARQLRINLLRLHSEYETINLIFKNISNKIISTENEIQGKDNPLQRYLNDTISNISIIRKKSLNRFETEDIDKISKEFVEYFDPGFGKSILEQLKNIRPQIYNKVEEFIESLYSGENEKPTPVINFENVEHLKMENIMGDKYEVGQAGAVGPNSKAENITFNQIWNQNKSDFDLPALSKELSELSKKMQSEADGIKQVEAVLAVSKAKEEAEKGNGEKVMEHLSKGGKWALEVAEKIGVGITIAALKVSMGL